MNNDDKIDFDYKRGHVVGIVKYFDEKLVICKLLTDYNGRNMDWQVGEFKNFNVKEMKNIKTIQT